MRVGPLRYAPWFAGWFLTWPVIAYMGAQGFTGLAVFLALPVLFITRPRGVPLYAAAFLAFLAWLLAVSMWSPGSEALFEGSFLSGTFTMDQVGPRVGLTALACMAVFMAVRDIPEASAESSEQVIRWTALVQFAGVVVTAAAMQPIISLIVATGQSTPPEMTQNLLRNANAFLLLLPWLVAWLWQSGRQGLAAAMVVLAFVAFALTGTQSAMIGTVLILAGFALVRVMPKNGFKALFGGLAAYIMAAPVLLAWGLAQLRGLGLPLPDSFLSRSYAWQLVGEKISEKPFFGHGLEAAHGWRDTFGDHPQWLAEMTAQQNLDATWQQAWSVYKVVPTHPHNMALQIWAETGFVGAFLLSASLVLLGWRLRSPADWPPIARYGAAGLAGAVLALFSFAYSMWNEAFWASVAVAAAIILLQARQDGEV